MTEPRNLHTEDVTLSSQGYDDGYQRRSMHPDRQEKQQYREGYCSGASDRASEEEI